MKTKNICFFIVIAILNACAIQNTSKVVLEPGKIIVKPSSEIPLNVEKQNDKSFLLTSKEIEKINNSNIVNLHNTFGINLFKDIVKEEKNKNVFMSPASASIALHMLYNGADKETKDEMAKTLILENNNLEEINELNRLFIKKLNNPVKDITLNVSNSVWFDKKRINIDNKFKNNLTSFYNAEANELDFSDSKSVETINSWASKKTNDKIPKIIENIGPEIVSILMNAIYFKSNWTEKFEERETIKRNFTLVDGTKKEVSLMSSFRDFRYYNNYLSYGGAQLTPLKRFEAAELTYGKDRKVSLFLFLPNQSSSLEKFYEQLTEENLDKWIQGFYNTQGYISFPKFKLKWEKELKNNLSNLGMASIFSKSANFTKMGKSPFGNISISRVLQSTYVDVNEEGTEAAAVTLIASSTAASSEPSTLRFVADRPFFYMIRDNETRTILFMGAVNDPKYE